MRLVDPLLMELDQEAQTTSKVLERVPDNKLTWRPHPKSHSLGQLALHIASVPGNVSAAAAQDTFEAPNFSQSEPKSRQEILDTFSKGLASAKETLNKMDDARLMSMWSLTRNGKVLMTVPRIGFIRSILMNLTTTIAGSSPSIYECWTFPCRRSTAPAQMKIHSPSSATSKTATKAEGDLDQHAPFVSDAIQKLAYCQTGVATNYLNRQISGSGDFRVVVTGRDLGSAESVIEFDMRLEGHQIAGLKKITTKWFCWAS